jgi:hypothetical protein
VIAIANQGGEGLDPKVRDAIVRLKAAEAAR